MVTKTSWPNCILLSNNRCYQEKKNQKIRFIVHYESQYRNTVDATMIKWMALKLAIQKIMTEKTENSKREKS